MSAETVASQEISQVYESGTYEIVWFTHGDKFDAHHFTTDSKESAQTLVKLIEDNNDTCGVMFTANAKPQLLKTTDTDWQ
jgi:hypothetical protein